jgi:hypothetical protein
MVMAFLRASDPLCRSHRVVNRLFVSTKLLGVDMVRERGAGVLVVFTSWFRHWEVGSNSLSWDIMVSRTLTQK